MTEAQRLATWIEESSRRDDAPGRLAKLVVSHVVKNRLGDELRAVKVPEALEDDWLRATAAKIIEHASGEAVTLGTEPQRYAVQAIFEGDDKPHGRLIFTCSGSDDSKALTTDEPNADGLVSEAMRQTRFFAELASRQQVAQSRSMADEISALRQENAELRSERLKSFKVMEEVYGLQSERESQRRIDGAKAKAIEDGWQKLSLLVPLALNHWSGKKLLPDGSTEILMLKSFAESISKDQMQQLGQVLDGAQIAQLIRVMTSISQPKADEAPANGAAPTPTTIVTLPKVVS